MTSRIFVRGAAGLPFLPCLAVAAELVETPVELRWLFRDKPAFPVAPVDYGPEEPPDVVARVPAPGAPLLEFLPLSEGVTRRLAGEELLLLGIWGPDPVWLSFPKGTASAFEHLNSGLRYMRGLHDPAFLRTWLAERLAGIPADELPALEPERAETILGGSAREERVEVLAAPYARWRRLQEPDRPLARLAVPASDPAALPSKARPFLPHTGLFCPARELDRAHDAILRLFEALAQASAFLSRQAARVAQLARPHWGVPIPVAEGAWLEQSPRLHPTTGARPQVEAYIDRLCRAGALPPEAGRLPDAFFYTG